MNVDPMWGEFTIAIMKQLGLLAAIMVIFVLGAIIFFRVKVSRAIYCEFIANGRSTFELLRYDPTDEGSEIFQVEAEHGIYNVPRDFRMLAKWPPGVPDWLQETVPHDKWTIGTAKPIAMPDTGEPSIAAMEDLQLKQGRAAVLKTAAEELRKQHQENSMMQWIPAAVAAGVTVMAIGIATYFVIDRLELIQRAIGA